MSQRYSNLNTQLKPDFDSKGKPSQRVGLKGRLLVLPDREHWIKMGAKLRTQGGKCVGKISLKRSLKRQKCRDSVESKTRTGSRTHRRFKIHPPPRSHKQTTQTDQTDGLLIWGRRKKKWSWNSEILMGCRLIDVMAEQVSPSESKSRAEMETSNSRPTLDLEYGPAGKSTHTHWWGRSWSVDSPSLS